LEGSRIQRDGERLMADRLGAGFTMYWSLVDLAQVGAYAMPARIEVNLSTGLHDPDIELVVRVISGVPRCTELVITRREDGREVRPKDLAAIDLETMVEVVSARWLGEIEPDGGVGFGMGMVFDADWTRQARRAITKLRDGSRRPVTTAELQQVADVYNAHETGGLEAVMVAIRKSESTAARRIRDARKAGLIGERKR